MNTFQIDKILKRNNVTQKYYLGCYPSDCIPWNSTFYPYCVVVNTDPSNLSGTHWVALFCTSSTSIDYYDSLGMWPPISIHIIKYLKRFERICFNNIMLQQPFTHTCAYHVIYFLYKRCLGFSLNNIILNLNQKNSDKYVTEFVKKQIFNINR